MQAKVLGSMRVRSMVHGILSPLLVAATLSIATAASPPPAPAAGGYRVVPLSADTQAFGSVNARGQVAFTERAGRWRARFYDGATIHDIGTLSGLDTYAYALNDHGYVVGGSGIDPSSSRRHAYIWSRSGGLRDLHPPGQDQVDSVAIGINNKRQIIGTGSQAFRWSAAAGFEALVGEPTAINGTGVVVGSVYVPDETGNPRNLPVRWLTPGNRQFLADQGGLATGALDINAGGKIVGNAPAASAPFAGRRAFYWTPQQGLYSFPTAGLSDARRINDHGLVIGSLSSGGTSHGFAWSQGAGLSEIGAGSPEWSTADDVNNAGQVVGLNAGRAYSWTRSAGLLYLDARLRGAPPGLVLGRPQGVADSGAILVTANTGLVLLVPEAASCNTPVAAPVSVIGRARVNALLSFTAHFTDADAADTHQAVWSWGDGSANAAVVSTRAGAGNASGQHAYRKPGIYTARLTVTDSQGRSSAVERKVVVGGTGAD